MSEFNKGEGAPRVDAVEDETNVPQRLIKLCTENHPEFIDALTVEIDTLVQRFNRKVEVLKRMNPDQLIDLDQQVKFTLEGWVKEKNNSLLYGEYLVLMNAQGFTAVPEAGFLTPPKKGGISDDLSPVQRFKLLKEQKIELGVTVSGPTGNFRVKAITPQVMLVLVDPDGVQKTGGPVGSSVYRVI